MRTQKPKITKYLPKELTDRSTILLRIFAVIFIVCLLAQLFSFEKFPSVMYTYLLTTDKSLTSALAVAIVVLELLALPYLLSIKTNHYVTVISRYALAGAAMFWLILVGWGVGIGSNGMNSGLLGATIEVPLNIPLVVFVIISSIIAIFTAFDLKNNKTVSSV